MTEIRRAEVDEAWIPLLSAAWTMRQKDWTKRDLYDAYLAVKAAGWTFEQFAVELWRMVWDADARPYELRNAARKPNSARQDQAGAYQRGAALAKRLLQTGPQAAAPGRDTA